MGRYASRTVKCPSAHSSKATLNAQANGYHTPPTWPKLCRTGSAWSHLVISWVAAYTLGPAIDYAPSVCFH
eukprot:6067984-Prymnesium_polylepis.2